MCSICMSGRLPRPTDARGDVRRGRPAGVPARPGQALRVSANCGGGRVGVDRDQIYRRSVTIRVLPYSPTWPGLFQQEATLLRARPLPWLSDGVEHIGSTAVPGLVAKPILDMLAPVVDLNAARDHSSTCRTRLLARGPPTRRSPVVLQAAGRELRQPHTPTAPNPLRQLALARATGLPRRPAGRRWLA